MYTEYRKKIRAAGRSAIKFKEKGFHCSESVFMAINETLKITDPAMARIVTGFHGGGGTHRTEPGVDLTALLAGIASGKEQRPDEEIAVELILTAPELVPECPARTVEPRQYNRDAPCFRTTRF